MACGQWAEQSSRAVLSFFDFDKLPKGAQRTVAQQSSCASSPGLSYLAATW